MGHIIGSARDVLADFHLVDPVLSVSIGIAVVGVLLPGLTPCIEASESLGEGCADIAASPLRATRQSEIHGVRMVGIGTSVDDSSETHAVDGREQRAIDAVAGPNLLDDILLVALALQVHLRADHTVDLRLQERQFAQVAIAIHIHGLVLRHCPTDHGEEDQE